jgi:hypothetical protein
MIAIDPPVRFLTFLLHPRGRPHMAQRAKGLVEALADLLLEALGVRA